VGLRVLPIEVGRRRREGARHAGLSGLGALAELKEEHVGALAEGGRSARRVVRGLAILVLVPLAPRLVLEPRQEVLALHRARAVVVVDGHDLTERATLRGREVDDVMISAEIMRDGDPLRVEPRRRDARIRVDFVVLELTGVEEILPDLPLVDDRPYREELTTVADLVARAAVVDEVERAHPGRETDAHLGFGGRESRPRSRPSGGSRRRARRSPRCGRWPHGGRSGSPLHRPSSPSFSCPVPRCLDVSSFLLRAWSRVTAPVDSEIAPQVAGEARRRQT
jgi:hypothetical protein